MTTTSVNSDLLVQLASPIWELVLGMNASARPFPDAPSLPIELVAQVDIRGAWRGSVLLAASHQFAQHAAARMFSADDGAIDAADAEDALGELANMVAGAAKSVLPQPSRLSIPVVRRMDESRGTPSPTGRTLTQVSFQCGDGRVQAMLVEDGESEFDFAIVHPPTL